MIRSGQSAHFRLGFLMSMLPLDKVALEVVKDCNVRDVDPGPHPSRHLLTGLSGLTGASGAMATAGNAWLPAGPW
jgi:hypothetical protein